MGRRRRNDEDWLGVIGAVVGLVVLLSLVSPQWRELFFALGFVAVCLICSAWLLFVGFVIYRIVNRSESSGSRQSFGFRIGFRPASKTLDPQAAAELVERLNRPDLADSGPPYEFQAEDRPTPSTPDPRTMAGFFERLSRPRQRDSSHPCKLEVEVHPLSKTSHPPRPGPLTTVELLAEIRAIDWFQFEKLVAAVYRKRGYAVTRRGGANADGGIDSVIEKNGQRSAIQCKQWKESKVRVNEVREFLGALTAERIPKGIFVTLCGYTDEARLFAHQNGIEVLDEAALLGLIETTDARFDSEVLEIFRDKRKICPKCESEMVLRTAAKGAEPGRQFWGCSTFPRCRFIMPYP